MNYNQGYPNSNPYMRNVNQNYTQQPYQMPPNQAHYQRNAFQQGYQRNYNQMPNAQPMMRGMGFPLQTPRVNPSSLAQAGTAGASKGLNLGKFLNGTQNMISTVTQAIPIYQQVKPLVSNSKILTGAIKKFFNKSSSTSTSTAREIIRDPEVVNRNSTNPKQRTMSSKAFNEQSHPNRPFF